MARAHVTRPTAFDVLVLASVLAAASTADAQIQATTWTPIQEGLAVTAVLGRAGTSTRQHASFEIATRLDTPVDRNHLVRLEVAKAAWRFHGTEYTPGPEWGTSGPGVPVSDRIAITRVTASVVRRHMESLAGEWTPFYVGGGIGAYHYRSLERQPYGRPWRAGIHGIAGMEFPIPSTRIAIAGEVQIHLPGIPARSVARGDWFFTLASASLGMKIRM